MSSRLWLSSQSHKASYALEGVWDSESDPPHSRQRHRASNWLMSKSCENDFHRDGSAINAINRNQELIRLSWYNFKRPAASK